MKKYTAIFTIFFITVLFEILCILGSFIKGLAKFIVIIPLVLILIPVIFFGTIVSFGGYDKIADFPPFILEWFMEL